VFICIHTHARMSTSVRVCVCVRVCVRAYIYAYIHIHTHVDVCVYIRIYTRATTQMDENLEHNTLSGLELLEHGGDGCLVRHARLRRGEYNINFYME